MEAKKFLEQIRRIDAEINSKLCEVECLRDTATSITSVLRDVPTFGTGVSDRVGNITAKIVDLEEEINKDVDRLIELRCEAIKFISKLEPTQYKVLYARYFLYRSWGKIAFEMNYSKEGIRKIHAKALSELEKELPKVG